MKFVGPNNEKLKARILMATETAYASVTENGGSRAFTAV